MLFTNNNNQQNFKYANNRFKNQRWDTSATYLYTPVCSFLSFFLSANALNNTFGAFKFHF